MGTSWASLRTAAAVEAAQASVPTRAHTSVAVPRATASRSQLALPPSPSKRTPARGRRRARRRLRALMPEHLQPGFKVKHEGMNQRTK